MTDVVTADAGTAPGLGAANRLLWILKLVPLRSGGRWLSALGLLIVFFAFYGGVGWLAQGLDASHGLPGWSVVLFFCVILAYVPPTFHFVIERTENAFDELQANVLLTAAELAQMRDSIRHKSWRWVTFNLLLGASLWLLQSLVLSGSWQQMWAFAFSGPLQFAGAAAALPVWIFMTCCLHALVDNARLFRELAQSVRVDIHNTPALMPVGAMAVSSIVLIVGAQALFPLMWLGGELNPWTTIPGVLATVVPMVYLFVAPIWPLHKRMQAQRRAAQLDTQEQINALTADGTAEISALTPLLSYRRELAAIPDWPFDLGILSRLLFYLIIVPVTWIGAALIEILVDLYVAS